METEIGSAWPRWLTTASVAKYIDRSEAGIRGLVRRGEIPFVKQGGTLYFGREEIDRWMVKGRQQHGTHRAKRHLVFHENDQGEITAG